MSNETYTDLEKKHARQKRDSIDIEYIKQLIVNYHDDLDLGAAVRKYFLQQNKNK